LASGWEAAAVFGEGVVAGLPAVSGGAAFRQPTIAQSVTVAVARKGCRKSIPLYREATLAHLNEKAL
jgi:hypothetical protein